MSSLHISSAFVARALRCRCVGLRNPMCIAHRAEIGAGVVSRYVKPTVGSTAGHSEHICVRSKMVVRYAG